MAQIPSALKDAAYVAIGFGVLTFQRAQVQRQELSKTVDGARESLEDRLKLVEERLEAVQSDVDKLLDDVETRLPDQARELLKVARGATRSLRSA